MQRMFTPFKYKYQSNMEGNMKAMYIKEPGQVEFIDVEKPVRKKGEVLLKLLYGGFIQGNFCILRLSKDSRS